MRSKISDHSGLWSLSTTKMTAWSLLVVIVGDFVFLVSIWSA